MNKPCNKLLLLIAVLFAVNCDDAQNGGGDGGLSEDARSPLVTSAKPDTLCAYIYWEPKDLGETHLFQDEAELNAFLDITEYSTANPIKEMAHHPNFKERTYFAFVGDGWKNTIDISYENDAVTIIYTEYSGWPPCEGPNCTFIGRPMCRIVVYSIPFTEKAINFTKTIKQIDTWEMDN